MLPTTRIVRANSQKAVVAATVIDEPSSGVFGRFQAMHNPRPKIDHLDCLRPCSEITNVLLESDIVVLNPGWTRLQRLGLDMISNLRQVILLLCCPLLQYRIQHISYRLLNWSMTSHSDEQRVY